jgi:hypothetical protein
MSANENPADAVPDESALGLDLVWGVQGISRVIGRSKRATFHLLETNRLPARRIGGRWVSSRGALSKHFEIGEVA